jgi:hypothetical protein
MDRFSIALRKQAPEKPPPTSVASKPFKRGHEFDYIMSSPLREERRIQEFALPMPEIGRYVPAERLDFYVVLIHTVASRILNQSVDVRIDMDPATLNHVLRVRWRT